MSSQGGRRASDLLRGSRGRQVPGPPCLSHPLHALVCVRSAGVRRGRSPPAGGGETRGGAVLAPASARGTEFSVYKMSSVLGLNKARLVLVVWNCLSATAKGQRLHHSCGLLGMSEI